MNVTEICDKHLSNIRFCHTILIMTSAMIVDFITLHLVQQIKVASGTVGVTFLFATNNLFSIKQTHR